MTFLESYIAFSFALISTLGMLLFWELEKFIGVALYGWKLGRKAFWSLAGDEKGIGCLFTRLENPLAVY